LAGLLKINCPNAVYGSLFKMENLKMVRVYTLSKITKEYLLYLQPGAYKIIYRAENSRKASDTNVLNFSIKSNENTAISLQ
jgi:hypothetical protein